MLAVMATGVHPSDPLSCLEVGERPEPTSRAGWVTVKVRAASLNHHDLWSLQGVTLSPRDRLPRVLGSDASGVLEDGQEVICHPVVNTGRRADERAELRADHDETLSEHAAVLTEHYDGTQAEYVSVPWRNVIAKPPELSFEEAACLPVVYLSVYRMLFTQAQLRPGDRLLVQGAGGGVATAAILLGKAAGLRVWVTSRAEDKRRRALDLGADEAFEPGARLPERVDAVMETVGEETWAHSLRALRRGGTVLLAGATSGQHPSAELRRLFARQLRVMGSFLGTRGELVRLVDLLRATGTRPLIDRRVSLADAPEAYKAMLSGELFGKVVFTLPKA